MTNHPEDPQAIHRLAKALLDRGAAASVADAENRLRDLRIQFRIDAPEASRREHQATLLSGVALARRVFLGGVFVDGALDAPLLVPLTGDATLGDAVRTLGTELGDAGADVPVVYVGGGSRSRADGFAVRTVGSGWRGGIVPAEADAVLNDVEVMPLVTMLCAALAVNEAFLAVSGDMPAAGRRRVGMSLWSLASTDWLAEDGGPTLAYLPSRLWLIGLGHLGQAFVWCLRLLPYLPGQLELLLQDCDRTTVSTWTTSILTDPPHAAKPPIVGIRKTRLVAAWAEARGFSTAICERYFDADVRRQDSEPSIALCGVDNGLARRALDKTGFDFIVSAGLGDGHHDFRTIRLHTLPGERKAEEIWRESDEVPTSNATAVYESLVASGALDRCGAAILAGTAVGAPFVGAVAAVLSVSEVLRLLHGGVVNRLVDLDLTSLEHKIVLPQLRDLSAINPGFVALAAR